MNTPAPRPLTARDAQDILNSKVRGDEQAEQALTVLLNVIAKQGRMLMDIRNIVKV